MRFDVEDLEVLYEDAQVIGVNKPAGVLVQGDASRDVALLDVVKLYLKRKHGKPGNVFLGLVHRLDRPVSGAVVFARTSKAAARLSRQFREGTPDKRYLAVVEGRLPAAAGELCAHLAARGDAQGVTRASLAPFDGSREARLRYAVAGVGHDRSLLAVTLLTGRRHQIRAQLALVGHPVWGDRKYGSARALGGRIALHAASLRIAHPVGGAPLEIAAPPPAVGWPWPAP